MTSRRKIRRQRLATMLVALAAMSPAIGLTQQPARADSGQVVIEGSGWGHGIGMSQYGAWGMAALGSSHRQILAHYFPGSSVASLGDGGGGPVPPVWVNLEQDAPGFSLRVDAISGGGEPVTVVRGRRSWIASPGSTIRIDGSRGCSMVITGPDGSRQETSRGRCGFDLSWYDWRGDGTPRTSVAVVGCAETDWNVTPAVVRECRYAWGMLHVRSGAGGLDLSAEMPIEDYLLGVSEMPYHWGDRGGMEALRAQAIAARSYARELQLHRGSPATNDCAAWCHVRDTTWDQRYVGHGHGQGNWIDAVRSTAGMVVTHPAAPNQGIVRTYYSSSTGGRTESIQEIRAGADALPYHQSVTDRWAVDGTIPNGNARWTVAVPTDRLASLAGLATVTSVEVAARTTGGSALTVAVTGTSNGGVRTVHLAGATIKTAFDLRSAYFSISFDGAGADRGGEATGGSAACTRVEAGESWQDVTIRLGLPWHDYPDVRSANPGAVNPGGHLSVGGSVCRPGTSGVSAEAAPCTEVVVGEGWIGVTTRLGLAASDYGVLRAANPTAENGAGYLVAGRRVCTPATGSGATGEGSSCVVALPGEGWVHVTERLGLPASSYDEVRAANPGAVNAGGYLASGGRVCRT